MSNLRKAVLARHAKQRTGLTASHQNYAPVKWSVYFDREKKVSTSDGVFHVYEKGSTGPIILCLHGGGYSGLTWALFAEEITQLIDCQIIAIDLRGHGNTSTSNDSDLCLETLSKDVVGVMAKLFGDPSEQPVVLIGHSMGGAIAVECSQLIPTTVGLCVIDVVEGTALDALSSMQSILRGRPSHFKSIQHAIQWCFKGGQTHNVDAAKVSMPGQIINMKNGNLASDECDTTELQNVEELSPRDVMPVTISEIREEDETVNGGEGGDGCDFNKPPLPKSAKTEYIASDDGPKYTWRIDLSKTERFWCGWFKGLSEKFLNVTTPKLLLLANIHGLDTTLTIGQMQGKFQLQVLARSGHAIHEDQPYNVAEIIAGYLIKQKIAVGKVELATSMPGC